MAKKSERQMLREQSIREELQEILAMFDALGRSYDTIADKSGITESFVRFDGFDANDVLEHEYLRLLRQMDSISRRDRAINSHSPRLRGYRLMMQAWRNSRDKENLTKEDVLRIIHPTG